MNTSQLRKARASLLGYWPTPTLSDEEGMVLTADLAHFDLDDFEAVIEHFVGEGRTFRPTPAEILAALRDRKRRENPSAQRPASYDHVDCRDCHDLLGRFMDNECRNGLNYPCPLREQYGGRRHDRPQSEKEQAEFSEAIAAQDWVYYHNKRQPGVIRGILERAKHHSSRDDRLAKVLSEASPADGDYEFWRQGLAQRRATDQGVMADHFASLSGASVGAPVPEPEPQQRMAYQPDGSVDWPATARLRLEEAATRGGPLFNEPKRKEVLVTPQQ